MGGTGMGGGAAGGFGTGGGPGGFGTPIGFTLSSAGERVRALPEPAERERPPARHSTQRDLSDRALRRYQGKTRYL